MPTFLDRLRDTFAKTTGVFRATRASARMDEEMRTHVDMLAERNAARGMTPDDARRTAQLAFGARERFREETRDEIRSRPLDDLSKDVHYAVRGIRRHPGLAVTIIATLALGIGAFTSVFSVVNGVLLEPLPYANADRLVTVWQHWKNRPGGPGSISPAEYFDYVDQQRSLDAWGVYAPGTSNILGDGSAEPMRLPSAALSAGALEALGVRPILGRLFTADDDHPGANRVVLISEGLWKSRYGGDSSVINRSINLNGSAATIAGVLPADFRMPDEMASPSPAQLFAPLALDRTQVKIRGSHYLSSVGRLRPDVTVERANAEFGGIVTRFSAMFPADYPPSTDLGVETVPLRTSVVGTSRAALWLLLGAVFFVLLIACANAASLLLARADVRRDEFAIRTALGGSRLRLVRQLLVESVTLAAIAALLGVVAARFAMRGFVAWHPVNLPRLAQLSVDGRVLAFAIVVALVCAVAFGLAPALQLVRRDVTDAIARGGRGQTGNERRRRMRRVLVAAELALTVVLLFGAALLSKSFARTLAVDPGFRVDHVLTAAVNPPRGIYDTDEKVTGFYQQLGERIRALTGVRAAGNVAGVPLVAPRGDMGIEFEGHPVPPGQPHPQIDWQVVTPGYFAAIGMRMQQGREIASTDLATTRGVVVVNETMVKKYWPSGDAIGKRFKLGGGARPDTATVVGVVADVRQGGLAVTPHPEMYLAQAQFRFWGGGGILTPTTLVVRTSVEPTALASAVRQAIRDFAPNVPIGAFRTMEELRSASVAQARFAMLVVALSATIAFVIAIVGLYGVVAYSVTQRRKEFGVRIALGAAYQDITRLVVRESALIAAGGLAVGLPGAVLFGRTLEKFLFGVRATDPALLIAVPAALTLVAFLAAYVPARRASRVDPMHALRVD